VFPVAGDGGSDSHHFESDGQGYQDGVSRRDQKIATPTNFDMSVSGTLRPSAERPTWGREAVILILAHFYVDANKYR
jgi:hypothetical protein